jgi:hypothetical protein
LRQVEREKRKDACEAQHAIKNWRQEMSQEQMALSQAAMMAILGRLAGVTTDKPPAPSA